MFKFRVETSPHSQFTYKQEKKKFRVDNFHQSLHTLYDNIDKSM